MINHYWTFFLFLIKAKYRHGIHSPFVFQLVDYFHHDKTWQKTKKWPLTQNQYTQINLVFKQCLKSFAKTVANPDLLKIIFYDVREINLHETLDTLEDKNQIIVLESLFYQRKKWNRYSRKTTHVMIDFYFWGICYRRNQAGQFFLIRIL